MSLDGWVILLGLSTALSVLLWRGVASSTWTPRSRGSPGADPGMPPVALVPETLDLLALALQGGASLGGAVRAVAATLPDDVGRELDEVGLALLSGADASDAWTRAGAAWAPARRCLEVAAEAGVSPGPSLRQAATDLRRAALTEVEVATARLGVRLVLPLGLAFLPAFVLTTVVPLVLALTRDLSW